VGELPRWIIVLPLMVQGERNTRVTDIAMARYLTENYALSSADLQFTIARLSQ
jgi:hypothetical protein